MTGHRVTEDWIGQQVETLADIWPDRPRAMIVGLNPAPRSVAAGHYYQGASGQRQLKRLVQAGVLGTPAGSYFEDVALEAGIGFTDIVKRPSAGEADVSAAEITYGSTILSQKLGERDVPLVICVFRHPVKALLGHDSPPGLAQGRTPWGASVFRLPGPFQARSTAEAVMATLPPLLR